MKKLLLFIGVVGLLHGCTKEIPRIEYVSHESIDSVMIHDTVSTYPVPNDSTLIFLVYDTVPNFLLDSIVITDQGDQKSRMYQPVLFLGSWIIRPASPMICNIRFYYKWIEPNNLTISMYTFNYTQSWINYPKNPSPHADVHDTMIEFHNIDVTKVFTIIFVNHV